MKKELKLISGRCNICKKLIKGTSQTQVAFNIDVHKRFKHEGAK